MRTTWVRVGVLLAVLVAGTVVALTVELPDVGTVRRWVEGAGVAGLVLLALGKGALLVGPVPRSALCVLLGVVLGFWTGAAVAYAGGLLGATAAFGLSRSLGRETAVRLAGPRLAAVDRAVAGRGFVTVLVARVLPMAPFAVLSHAAGLSAVPFRAYTAGTALALLPTTALQVGVGAAVPGLRAWAARAGSPWVFAVVATAALGAAGVVWLRRRRARSGPVEAG
ncbi:TVP38/TMEM64 family protein [Geodermatophilus sp. SYSU D00525]